MEWIVAAALFAILLWCVGRAKENAEERLASGEARSPLFWVGNALAIAVLALSMLMAHLRPSRIHWSIWVLFAVLFAATLLVRRALKWRYPH